jgi:hypothetical protein
MNKNDRPIGLMLVDPKTDKETQFGLAKFELTYAVLGLIAGLLCMVGGIFLFYQGITGSMDWTAKFFVGESKITNAAPGAVLFLIGLFVILGTRYKFKHVKPK